jgi:hypothetical protein
MTTNQLAGGTVIGTTISAALHSLNEIQNCVCVHTMNSIYPNFTRSPTSCQCTCWSRWRRHQVWTCTLTKTTTNYSMKVFVVEAGLCFYCRRKYNLSYSGASRVFFVSGRIPTNCSRLPNVLCPDQLQNGWSSGDHWPISFVQSQVCNIDLSRMNIQVVVDDTNTKGVLVTFLFRGLDLELLQRHHSRRDACVYSHAICSVKLQKVRPTRLLRKRSKWMDTSTISRH